MKYTSPDCSGITSGGVNISLLLLLALSLLLLLLAVLSLGLAVPAKYGNTASTLCVYDKRADYAEK
jgi:hypothetical protein